MSVKLNTRQVGDVSVVDVAGRITLGEGSSALRDAMRDMVSKDQKKILLNLGEVSYIDSSGIGELVSGFHHRHQQRRPVEAAQPEQAGEGPAADHQAVHGFRRARRRSAAHPQLRVDRGARRRELVGGRRDPSRDAATGSRAATVRERRYPPPTNCTISRLRAGARATVVAPVRLFDDAAVQLHGHARGVELQFAAASPRIVCSVGDGARLAVDDDLDGMLG